MADASLTLADRYRLDEVIGRGGMAEVWRGRDLRLGRDVAIKRLRADLATDPTFQARFQREAQSAAGLNHPNIVAVYDTGSQVDPASGVAVPYIVMELVHGRTLRDLLRDGVPISTVQALTYTQGVLDALAYSHQRGIVHRDIKPANVMLTPDNVVKVMDFGIARAVSDTSATMTQTAAVIGTAQYLSPEQARGETVDARSDVYSTGCLLYELLTSRPPFVGDSPVSVAYQHVREMPIPPSQLNPMIPPAVDAIVMQSLAKSPSDRYQSAQEMRDDIARALAGREVQAAVPVMPQGTALVPPEATRVMTAPPAPPSGEPETATQTGPLRLVDDEDEEPAPRKRISAAAIVLIVLAVVVVVGVVIVALKLHAQPPDAEQIPVPTVTQMDQASGQSALQGKNLLGKITTVTADGTNPQCTLAQKGQIIAQDPTPGTMVPSGSQVSITVCQGPGTIVIPSDLGGRSVDDAINELKSMGWTGAPTSSTAAPNTAPPTPSTAQAGQIIGTNPAPGTTIQVGDPITFNVNSGQCVVPAVAGSDQPTATTQLTALGFSIAKPLQSEYSDTVASGLVAQTSPQAGQTVPCNQPIVLFISQGPTPPPSTEPPSSTPSESAPPSDSPGPTPGESADTTSKPPA
ncbi:MAG: Stk1 family PASTA domain-containing Ser/Thr kinase [Propionibacteriaceae bacterium]|nr:Stk1 family PASTA domain-containing Ser/Thr kinase [Propionibacteriaceae bacterium]